MVKGNKAKKLTAAGIEPLTYRVKLFSLSASFLLILLLFRF